MPREIREGGLEVTGGLLGGRGRRDGKPAVKQEGLQGGQHLPAGLPLRVRDAGKKRADLPGDPKRRLRQPRVRRRK
jgi:hypothetical protein